MDGTELVESGYGPGIEKLVKHTDIGTGQWLVRFQVQRWRFWNHITGSESNKETVLPTGNSTEKQIRMGNRPIWHSSLSASATIWARNNLLLLHHFAFFTCCMQTSYNKGLTANRNICLGIPRYTRVLAKSSLPGQYEMLLPPFFLRSFQLEDLHRC